MYKATTFTRCVHACTHEGIYNSNNVPVPGTTEPKKNTITVLVNQE
jgi:hypothetical protein